MEVIYLIELDGSTELEGGDAVAVKELGAGTNGWEGILFRTRAHGEESLERERGRDCVRLGI